jgi:tRNA(adenine34) deaminase
MWEALSHPWQACVEEAWAAYCAGSFPIGAAITETSGNIITRGRNRIFESSAEDGQIHGHRLAHAEVNALLNLDYNIDPTTCTLYITTEPCPLCVGAICMAGVRTVKYAACDPTAGGKELLKATPFLRSRKICMTGPAWDAFEAVLVALRVERRFRMGKGKGIIVQALEAKVPTGARLGARLFETGQLWRMCETGVDAATMLNMLFTMLGEA